MIIAIANQKGGVAKTTSTIALGGLLAEQGSCLVVDFDPQGNLTTGLGVKIQPDQKTAYEVLIDRKQQAAAAIVETKAGVSLLPADISLATGEKQILTVADNSRILRKKLNPLRQDYEHILIDCPPSLGMLTLNALMAADTVLIPVQCQFFALEGLRQLLETIDGIRDEDTHPELQILGVLPTMADRTLTTQDALKTLQAKLTGIKIFEPVPKSVQFPESNLAREPIHQYTSEQKLTSAYRAVVQAIVEQV
ncbi:ParA family protein [Trichocoleus sp. FACHB-591]|uniref:ParA family protein n=1 Tax=Trichocoleus sp. FACHB-591 TaxID=2692872 RepID=UPI00168607A1|nr:AAA family ATPase [Trichocoleus sp. FACHB-591]MBD2094313.1 ParA family protein [Trichocoleus sp. FACHB-591]